MTSWNINLARGDQLGIRHFGSKPDGLEAGLVSRLDKERHKILMSQVLGHYVQVRREGDW